MKTIIHIIIFTALGVVGANYAHAIEKCVDPVTKKVTFTDTGCAAAKAEPVARADSGTFSTTDSSGIKPQKVTSLETHHAEAVSEGPSVAGGTNAADAAAARKKRSAEIARDSAKLKRRK